MEYPKIELQDLEDLKFCGKFFWENKEKKELFYSLKDCILINYGFQYGYTLQSWDDLDYEDEWTDNNGITYYEAYATHCHILKRYYLSTQDGNYISYQFHIPTEEFAYYSSYPTKKSEKYDELYELITEKIEGKKKKIYLSESFDKDTLLKVDTVLNRLNLKFGFLLNNNKN